MNEVRAAVTISKDQSFKIDSIIQNSINLNSLKALSYKYFIQPIMEESSFLTDFAGYLPCPLECILLAWVVLPTPPTKLQNYNLQNNGTPHIYRSKPQHNLCTSKSDQVESNCFVDAAIVSANFSIIAEPQPETTHTSQFLRTPSPMEKQAANTRKMFIKFQDELIETMANPATKIDDAGTITTYRVAKFGENRASQLP
ncbi:hypothetical protein KIW84_061615 [Lathyrus oleraceus]|uniref:Uncharacterized protein n=1 Tax=Pisum sativum TaxID=3888 RepID=A0A9D4W5H9_PEA|nr:hypothetical protein KIW84_061615 [Pisum sativum]